MSNAISEELKVLINAFSLTDSDLDNIKSIKKKHEEHPLKRLLCSDDEAAKQTLCNTSRALKNILFKKREWLSKSIRKRLLNKKDFTESSSVLAEIRGLGYLLEAGFDIDFKKLNESRPEYWIKKGSDEAIVEVHSKHMSAEEMKALENHHNQPFDSTDSPIQFREHIITPFGKPKNGKENTTINVIQKLAGIKNVENQFSKNITSILWLDFQGETWSMAPRPRSIFPVSSWREGFYSGEFWYAFYGWKGCPVFEGMTHRHIKKMQHDGRFYQTTNIDAVVISLLNTTLIMENPNSAKKIKNNFIENIFRLPWYRHEYSYLNWPAQNLQKRLDYDIENILALEEQLKSM